MAKMPCAVCSHPKGNALEQIIIENTDSQMHREANCSSKHKKTRRFGFHMLIQHCTSIAFIYTFPGFLIVDDHTLTFHFRTAHKVLHKQKFRLTEMIRKTEYEHSQQVLLNHTAAQNNNKSTEALTTKHLLC